MKEKLKYRPSLFSKLIFSHFAVVLLTLLVMGFLLIHFLENYFYGTSEVEIREQALDVAEKLEDKMKEGEIHEVEETARELSEWLEVKIRVLDNKGTPLIIISPDEEGGSQVIEEEEVGLEEREIEHVLAGNQYTKKVYGPHMQRLLVAIPIVSEVQEEYAGTTFGEIEQETAAESGEEPEELHTHGMVTLSAPLGEIEDTLNHISELIIQAGAIGAVLAGIVAFVLAKKITNPLQIIRTAALNMASGNFRQKINLKSHDEIEDLANTFNYSVEQVEKTINAQKKLEELRRNLVANVSHELRAPLSSMRGYTEIMLDGLIDKEEQDKYLHIILENSEHLSRLVDDLLDLSRLESGELSLYLEEAEPAELAALSMESIKPSCDEKDIELQMDEKHDLPCLIIDRDRVHQIITNLLENAVAHTPSGGKISLNLYLSVGPGKQPAESRDGQPAGLPSSGRMAEESKKNAGEIYVVFEVSDDGAGIPEEDLPYIWERFHKVDKSRRRNRKGTGLGLAITKQLVELHGGTVEAESRLKEGSTFRVYLPANSDSSAFC